MIEYLFEFFLLSFISYLGGRLLINYCFNYKTNRYWLLFCLCVSILIPLGNFEVNTNSVISSINLEEIVVNDALNIISKSLTNASKSSTITIESIIFIFYITIALFLLFRFFSNINFILKKRKNAKLINYEGTDIYILDEDIKPFTFLKYIFISKSDLLHQNKEQLINHEILHKNLNHSLDILLIEFLKVIFWFNPVLYFYKTLIQSNHEYEVDNAIISNGFDAKLYTHVIIDYTFKSKTKYYNLSSGFSLSLIKNRIHMISKFKKNKSSFKQSLAMFSLLILMFLSTAFTLDTSGYFSADSISYVQKENKLYLQGDNIEVNFQEEEISGKGTFSFLGKIDYLKINNKIIKSDAKFDVEGKKCLIKQIIDKKEFSKLGLNNNAKAFEITITEK